MLETNEKMDSFRTESLSKEIKGRKNQMEILWYAVTAIKKTQQQKGEDWGENQWCLRWSDIYYLLEKQKENIPHMGIYPEKTINRKDTCTQYSL